jgi:aspartyl-tRNA(Asn)/glutamyl-tRNA(Gln) amidotransferase subunit B
MFRLALASRCGETTSARIFGREKVRGSLASSSSSHHRWYAAPSTKMMAQSHEDDDEWETVVGLELHVQLAADTKLFSG